MKYVIYARKSTEDEDRQILSIEAQIFELKEFAAKEKLEIVAFFEEAKTAKEHGRIRFAEMLSFLEKGKADGIISWHPDRLATHEPLISKKLFDKCQEVISKRGKQKEIRKHHFAFLGLMRCGSCGCSITAEKQKGHNYYRCTKKKGLCQEKHYIREENLIEQIKHFLQKVSLLSQDTEKVFAELQKDESQAKEEAKTTVQNLKIELTEIEVKLEKLLDAYLGEVISSEDYKTRKEKLITRKVELGEKIRDFEQKGLSWLEPAREFVLSLNQAANLVESENKEQMTTFLKTIGSPLKFI